MVQELKKKKKILFYVSKTPERLWKKYLSVCTGCLYVFCDVIAKVSVMVSFLRTINLILTVPRSEDKAPLMFLLKLNILKTDWPFDPFG